MASLLDLSKSNLSYYTVPAAWTLAMLPQVLIFSISGKSYDPASPRRTVDNCAKDTSIDKKTLQRIQRARAAHNNGLETLGLYAAAVVAANVAGVPLPRLNYLTLGYLATRVAYNFVYVDLQADRRFAALRSLVWWAGMGLVVTLYVQAGRAVNAAS